VSEINNLMMQVSKEAADYIVSHANEYISVSTVNKNKQARRKHKWIDEYPLTHKLLQEYYDSLKGNK
jgi:5'(3')-deoxyribonucleotidase